ncbi:MAG: hypothetical protein KBT53_02875 [Porticoccus sp.]|nr:hypothetical protein [Porticoccus sp.]MBQ0807023.1 hypothetical protein [Porticoccus sp.]
MKKIKYSIGAFSLALIFWFIDTAIHYFVYNEPQFEFIPDDFNELWMRAVIVLLIIFFGIYADISTRRLLNKEKQLEAARIYNSMIHASQHILNNLLNQMQLFKMEALKSNDFDKDIIKIYDSSIDEATNLIQRLSQVEDITGENIKASVGPANIA